MKKRICFTAMAFLLLLTALTGCAKGNEPVAGGYSEDRKPDTDELAIFETATAELVGVSYVPTLVATQVVAGTNYRFTATATPSTLDAQSYTVYVYIYQPLEGEPKVSEIVEVK